MTSVCFIFEETKLLQFHKNEVSAITINQRLVFGVNQRHLTVKGRSIILMICNCYSGLKLKNLLITWINFGEDVVFHDLPIFFALMAEAKDLLPYCNELSMHLF